jgi:hypothetical protein
MLVTHANTNGVWPNFLVWSLRWLYASSVKNKNKQKQDFTEDVCFSLSRVGFENIRGDGRLSGQLSHKNRGGRRGNNHFIKMERIENPSIIQKFGPS